MESSPDCNNTMLKLLIIRGGDHNDYQILAHSKDTADLTGFFSELDACSGRGWSCLHHDELVKHPSEEAQKAVTSAVF